MLLLQVQEARLSVFGVREPDPPNTPRAFHLGQDAVAVFDPELRIDAAETVVISARAVVAAEHLGTDTRPQSGQQLQLEKFVQCGGRRGCRLARFRRNALKDDPIEAEEVALFCLFVGPHNFDRELLQTLNLTNILFLI